LCGGQPDSLDTARQPAVEIIFLLLVALGIIVQLCVNQTYMLEPNEARI
jgi:hypothetical protein